MCLRAEADAHVLALEQRNIQDRADVKEVMFARIRDAKEAVLGQAAELLDDTSKLLLVTNDQLVTELSYTSAMAERAARTNALLAEQQVGLRRQLALLSSENRELFARVHSLVGALRRETASGGSAGAGAGGGVGGAGTRDAGGAPAARRPPPRCSAAGRGSAAAPP